MERIVLALCLGAILVPCLGNSHLTAPTGIEQSDSSCHEIVSTVHEMKIRSIPGQPACTLTSAAKNNGNLMKMQMQTEAMTHTETSMQDVYVQADWDQQSGAIYWTAEDGDGKTFYMCWSRKSWE